MKPLRIAVAGCGMISAQYGKHIRRHPGVLEIAGAMDLDPARANEFIAQFGGTVYPDLDAILADPSVDLLLNLTIHHAHFDVNRRALRAGKHVFSEKPVALNFREAAELSAIARETGRRLAAAPGTFLGEGIQTASAFLASGRLGELRLVYAEVNWGQIERWIHSPAPYFSVGPLRDVGVYAITALVFLLGPVRRVWGYSRILKASRRDPGGNPFPVAAPDFTTGMLEFSNGVVARLTTNYYVRGKTMPHLRGLEFHGDEGSLLVGSYHDFNPPCHFHPYEGEPSEVPLIRPAPYGMDRALPLVETAMAIHQNRPHRCSAELACHVTEVMEALQKAAESGGEVPVESEFPPIPRMEWADA